MLTRLIYASRATENVSIGEVRSIIDAASRNNVVESVTGMLCFDRVNFFQCLEGKRDAVNRIYNKIVLDKRHTDIILLEYHEEDRRLFGSWSMAYLSAQEAEVKNLIKTYSPNEQFNPHELSARQASGLILDLSRNLQKETHIEIRA